MLALCSEKTMMLWLVFIISRCGWHCYVRAEWRYCTEIQEYNDTVSQIWLHHSFSLQVTSLLVSYKWNQAETWLLMPQINVSKCGDSLILFYWSSSSCCVYLKHKTDKLQIRIDSHKPPSLFNGPFSAVLTKQKYNFSLDPILNRQMRK